MNVWHVYDRDHGVIMVVRHVYSRELGVIMLV